MQGKRFNAQRKPPGSMTSIAPYSVGADSISAREVHHCRKHNCPDTFDHRDSAPIVRKRFIAVYQLLCIRYPM